MGAELSSLERSAPEVAEDFKPDDLGFDLAFSAASFPACRIAREKDVSAPPTGGFDEVSKVTCCLGGTFSLKDTAGGFLVGVEIGAAVVDVGGFDGVFAADVAGVLGASAIEPTCSSSSPYSFHSSTSSMSYLCHEHLLLISAFRYTYPYYHSHPNKTR